MPTKGGFYTRSPEDPKTTLADRQWQRSSIKPLPIPDSSRYFQPEYETLYLKWRSQMISLLKREGYWEYFTSPSPTQKIHKPTDTNITHNTDTGLTSNTNTSLTSNTNTGFNPTTLMPSSVLIPTNTLNTPNNPTPNPNHPLNFIYPLPSLLSAPEILFNTWPFPNLFPTPSNMTLDLYALQNQQDAWQLIFHYLEWELQEWAFNNQLSTRPLLEAWEMLNSYVNALSGDLNMEGIERLPIARKPEKGVAFFRGWDSERHCEK